MHQPHNPVTDKVCTGDSQHVPKRIIRSQQRPIAPEHRNRLRGKLKKNRQSRSGP